MKHIPVMCRCPKGHDVKTTFPVKKGNISNMLFNGDLIDQKVKGFCSTCKELTVLLVLNVLETQKGKEERFHGVFKD